MNRPWQIFMLTDSLSAKEREKIRAVLQLYFSLDNAIFRFKKASALQCIPRCGRCCENPKLEATVLEMLPLAVELWRQHKAEEWLGKAFSAGLTGPCILYQSLNVEKGEGRCSFYPFRALICRLFGFSAQTGKHQKLDLVTCRWMKESFPKEFLRAQELIHLGKIVPQMQPYAMRLLAIDPEMGRARLPINQAIRSAIERVGLFLKLEAQKKKKFRLL